MFLVKLFAVAAVLVTLAASPPTALAHSKFAAGRPGDPKKPARTVVVTMREDGDSMSFVPDRVEVAKGEQIRFVLRNVGVWDHEFMLDTPKGNAKHKVEMAKHPDMTHDDPNGKTVEVGERKELLWHFTKTGTFEFACLMPGHYEAGMKGIVIVRPIRK